MVGISTLGRHLLRLLNSGTKQKKLPGKPGFPAGVADPTTSAFSSPQCRCLCATSCRTLKWGFRRKPNGIPGWSRRPSERSDAGNSIAQEVFGFVKEKPVRSEAEDERRKRRKGCAERGG